MAGRQPTLILRGARVLTGDPELPEATGVRIEAGRVSHVWNGREPGGLTGEPVELGGAVVIPGLVDAHFHLRGLGMVRNRLDLRAVTGAPQAAEQVRKTASARPSGAWIHGRGWDHNRWGSGEFPQRELLDEAAPEHPVSLYRVDGHALWVNSRALRLAGIDGTTPDPEGGKILKDAAGQPTGILIDNAMDLVTVVQPVPGPADIRADLVAGIAACQRAGLTGVHDMGTDPEVLVQLLALEKEGALGLRVTCYLSDPGANFESLVARAPRPEGLVRVVGVKLYADGALGSYGAALLDPYADKADTRGLMLMSPEELARRTAIAHRAGYQVAIHAIGDAACRTALDAIESGQGGDGSRRHRVEHAQIIHPDDISRFGELGAVASFQPTHATSDMGWTQERLGPERLGRVHPWRKFIDSGAVIALGSDAPVELEDPWAGIYAAVTRQDRQGRPEGGWMGDQRLTLPEALAGFTSGAERAAGFEPEGSAGVVAPGCLADLTIVDRDPTAIAPRELLEVQTRGVLVDGRWTVEPT